MASGRLGLSGTLRLTRTQSGKPVPGKRTVWYSCHKVLLSTDRPFELSATRWGDREVVFRLYNIHTRLSYSNHVFGTTCQCRGPILTP